MNDLQKFCCLNEQCKDFKKRGSGNISIRLWYGKKKERRLLICSTCKTTFSERKGTPLFNSKIPEEKAKSIIEHLNEGIGIRKTARLTKTPTGTVQRLARMSGIHGKAIHNEKVRNVKSNEVQFDEEWNFVGKKRQKL
jgi:LacI family transcriptional regulator